MAEKYTRLYTELKGCVPSFCDDDTKYENTKQFIDFIESDATILDVKSKNFFLYYSQNGGGYTKDVLRIEKLSKWGLIDKFCYMIWIPWGIKQRYRVDTTDGNHYLVRFQHLGGCFLDIMQDVLHSEKR